MVKPEKLVRLVCEAIQAMQEINGCSLYEVASVPSIVDNRAMTPGRIHMALQLAVKKGILLQTKDGKYRLKRETNEERRDESKLCKPVKENQKSKPKEKIKRSSPINKNKAVQKFRIKSEPKHSRYKSRCIKRQNKYQRKMKTVRHNKKNLHEKISRKFKTTQCKTARRRKAIRSERKYIPSRKMIVLPCQLKF